MSVFSRRKKRSLLPTLNRVRITIDFSFGSGIFVYEKSHVTAYAYRDLRKPKIKRKNILFFLITLFFILSTFLMNKRFYE